MGLEISRQMHAVNKQLRTLINLSVSVNDSGRNESCILQINSNKSFSMIEEQGTIRNYSWKCTLGTQTEIMNCCYCFFSGLSHVLCHVLSICCYCGDGGLKSPLGKCNVNAQCFVNINVLLICEAKFSQWEWLNPENWHSQCLTRESRVSSRTSAS